MKKLAIGVDIGGINTAFGLVDENGDLYAESVISTKKYPYVDDYPAYVEDLCDSMRALVQSLSFEYELTGIGIGAPNANYHKGTIENPANLWKFKPEDPNPDEARRVFPLADDFEVFRRREDAHHQRCQRGDDRRDDLRQRQGHA